MSIFDSAMNLIEEGLSGKNIGVPFDGCPRLTEHIYGTRKGTYYLYGAETGVGKTKFVRDQHMYAVYDYYKQVNDESILDVRFLDFSLHPAGEGEDQQNLFRRLCFSSCCFVLSW